MNENSKRNYKLLISIIVTILVLGGATYAAWNFLSEKTNMVVSVDGDQINFNAGVDITIDGIVPVYNKEDSVVKEIEVYNKNGKYKSGIDIFLDLTSWPTELSHQSFRWALYKNDKYLSSGNFRNYRQGSTVRLTNNTQKLNLQENKDTYKVYLWIDGYQENNPNMSGKSFTVSLYGRVSFYDMEDKEYAEEVEPNAPELAEGMIPIKYDFRTDNWVKADTSNTNNDWYNYEEQYWANAVMVTSETRDRYMNASVDTPVLEDDILAYYVWIPRYKYLLFNVESSEVNPQEIQIEFQKTTDTIEEGTHNNEWLTHPAFWWDNNSDGVRDSGEELSGIWVGKFETGGTQNNPLVKPNIPSYTGANIYNLFYANKSIESNQYLTNNGTTQIDAHMMKNIEWGVVAYLSHSKYGINSEICINNSSSMITGRSGGNVGGSVNSLKVQYPSFSTSNNQYLGNGYYTYNDLAIDFDGNYGLDRDVGMGTCASTTGNISGIYDMSGGAIEYMMSVMKTQSGGIIYNNYSGFNDNNMVPSKYYILYDYGTGTSDFGRRILGDATGETRGWYSDSLEFPFTNYTWSARGGTYSGGAKSGIFNFVSYLGWNGRGDVDRASRSFIVLP